MRKLTPPNRPEQIPLGDTCENEYGYEEGYYYVLPPYLRRPDPHEWVPAFIDDKNFIRTIDISYQDMYNSSWVIGSMIPEPDLSTLALIAPIPTFPKNKKGREELYAKRRAFQEENWHNAKS